MEQDLRACVDGLLRHKGLILLPLGEKRLSGDGSDRMFYRLQVKGKDHSVIAVIPPANDARSLLESQSSWAIANHLANVGVPVPRLYGFDPESGILLFEDAGDQHLSDFLQVQNREAGRVENFYRKVLDILLLMQIGGRKGLTQSMCYDAFSYDRQTMIEREGLYFLRAFGRDLLQISFDEEAILSELHWLTGHIEDFLKPNGGEYFLHRDFQSRNIMVLPDGEIRILDFQAARKGPLAYDLASLLIDPYAALDDAVQARLFDYYCENLKRILPKEMRTLYETYPLLALQRNMQMLGAFAFLSQQKKKSFFSAFIPLALQRLKKRLDDSRFNRLEKLRNLVQMMDNKIAIGFLNE